MKSMTRMLVILAAALTFAANRPGDAASAPAAAPFSLSDPDGQELVLEDLSAKAAIHGMLSLTELEFRFRNPQNRRIEGRFTCVLPPNAAISRFAKEIDGHLMEGEVVERLRANQVYEQFLHVMRDPALLEQDQGNRFSARIFPIAPNGTVRILVSYSALLPLKNGARTYALPLRGLPKVNHLTFRALVQPLAGEESADGSLHHSNADVVTLEQHDAVPQHDIEMTWQPSANAPRRHVLRAGDFFVTAFRPEVPPPSTMAPRSWLICVDTSASSAEGAAHRIDALERMLAAMPADTHVQVEAFDQEITPIASGSASGVARTIGAALRQRLFLGGTDLAALLRHAGTYAAQHPDSGIVIASDFVATLGDTERHDVEAAAHAIPARTTLHALILGSREDAAVARAITAGRGRVIRIPFSESIEAKSRQAAMSIQRPLGASMDIREPAAEWVYPARVDDVQNGDEVIAIGKVKPSMEPAGQATQLSASNFGPLLEREGWRAYLDYLADREAGETNDGVRQALATEQVRISTEQRVVIPRTTMLVLETEWDYQRFGLDRRALAAILTVGAGGIERIDRRTSTPAPLPVQVATPAPKPAPPPLPARSEQAISAAPSYDNLAIVPDAKTQAAEGRVAEAITVTREPQAVTVTASAPAVIESGEISTNVTPGSMPGAPPPMRVAPPARLEERDQSDTSWTKQRTPTKMTIERLQLRLREHPDDRQVYNELAEALAAAGEWSALRTLALQWQPYDPENPQVYEVLALADEHLGNMAEAARANASLIEIAPAKPELLQRAGLLLLRDGRGALAEAPLRHALQARPDRANGYRHLALLLWREGRHEEAARVLESATRQKFPGWYGDVQRVIHEELGYVYRAWMAAQPSRRAEVEQRARDYDVDLTRKDALRVTLAWETDANDVDLHIVDPDGEECYYAHQRTKSGLELYQDITQGLGPEVIRTPQLDRGVYHVGVKYFAAGPMGVSRGIVVVMRNDDVEIYPFRLLEGGGEIRYVTQVAVK
jgi:tetratricopeptide (TPR) repeat protein